MSSSQIFQWILIGALLVVVYSIVKERGKGEGVEGFVSESSCAPVGIEGQFEYLPTGQKVLVPGPSPPGEFRQSDAKLWAQANPVGEGVLKGKNFLDAGYMTTGVDTVGQTRKTMNQQLRSDPVVPQFGHSVWRPDMFAPDDIERRIMNGATC